MLANILAAYVTVAVITCITVTLTAITRTRVRATVATDDQGDYAIGDYPAWRHVDPVTLAAMRANIGAYMRNAG